MLQKVKVIPSLIQTSLVMMTRFLIRNRRDLNSLQVLNIQIVPHHVDLVLTVVEDVEEAVEEEAVQEEEDSTPTVVSIVVHFMYMYLFLLLPD